METLSLEKFNPQKIELKKLSDEFKTLEIKGIDDVAGYRKVDEARKELKRKRVDIERQGKELRANAIKFQKTVISLERELVEMIEPVEIELSNKQALIDVEKEKVKRIGLLPERKDQLNAIDVVLEDGFILTMDNEQFTAFFNERMTLFLKEKEKKLNEERLKIEEEKRIREAENRARIEAEERAKREIELTKQRAELEKNEALKRLESEKKAIIEDNARKEKQRLEAEEQIKQEEIKRIEVEKEKQQNLEKQKNYKKFLKDNNFNENEDYLLNKGDKIILMRKVAEFIK